MLAFNLKLDKFVTKPVATAYAKITPKPVRGYVGNFFGNLSDPWIGVNNFLQGKPREGTNDLMRFVFNSTLGLGGILDIASEANMPKHDEDLGQTLAVWGFRDGPFVVLPLFGPKTTRDALAMPIEWTANSKSRFLPHLSSRDRNLLTGLELTNNRARVLDIQKTLDEGTLDKYRYTRDFYLQQRRYLIYDGNLPEEESFLQNDVQITLPPNATEGATKDAPPDTGETQ